MFYSWQTRKVMRDPPEYTHFVLIFNKSITVLRVDLKHCFGFKKKPQFCVRGIAFTGDNNCLVITRQKIRKVIHMRFS